MPATKVRKAAQDTLLVKKATKLRTSYLADEKFTGPEPSWTGEETGAAYDVKLREHIFYCNYHYSPKDLKKDVLTYFESIGKEKDYIRKLSTAYDSKSPVTVTTAANLCRASNSGANLIPQHHEYIAVTFGKMVSAYKSSQEEVTDVKAPAVKVATIQDRMAEKLSEVIAHFEGLYDQVVAGEKVDPETVKFLKAQNVAQAQIAKVAGHFTKYLNELNDAKEGADKQLKEAYGHYKTKDYQRHFDFLKRLIEGCDSYKVVKQVTRKPRVKKPADKTKLVARLKYLKSDNSFDLVSIRPEEIFTATELWVFNVKTRKLGRYVASEVDKTLSVKGSAIVGYDEQRSIAKTLRKPQEQLKEFFKQTKPNMKKFLTTIRATETLLNGRINEQVILLKVL